MEQTIAAAAAWALVLLCVALYRSGQWRVAVPIAIEAPDAPPVTASNGDDEAPAAEEPPRRRLRVPVGLAGAVVATAAVRISLLVALGR